MASISMNTSIKEEYILKVGEEGASRLSLLNEVHGSYSQVFLEDTKIEKNMKVLEIGCGTGHMALWMASHLVPLGKVYAIDVNLDQIQIAQETVKKQRITNIEFDALSIYDIDKISEKFDLIYCRYFLLHLVDPINALKKALTLLKPDGKIACEEPTISTSFCYPFSASYAKSRLLLKRLSDIKHLDFEIGMKLQEIFTSIGCKVLDINFIQPILKNKNERRLLDMLFDECSDLYVHHQLVTYIEIKQIKANLRRLAQDSKTLIGFPRTTQILVKNIA